jgi:hypothetical protein
LDSWILTIQNPKHFPTSSMDGTLYYRVMCVKPEGLYLYVLGAGAHNNQAGCRRRSQASLGRDNGVALA